MGSSNESSNMLRVRSSTASLSLRLHSFHWRLFLLHDKAFSTARITMYSLNSQVTLMRCVPYQKRLRHTSSRASTSFYNAVSQYNRKRSKASCSIGSLSLFRLAHATVSLPVAVATNERQSVLYAISFDPLRPNPPLKTRTSLASSSDRQLSRTCFAMTLFAARDCQPPLSPLLAPNRKSEQLVPRYTGKASYLVIPINCSSSRRSPSAASQTDD